MADPVIKRGPSNEVPALGYDPTTTHANVTLQVVSATQDTNGQWYGSLAIGPAMTADSVAAANVTEVGIGLYNSSGSVMDRLRDAGSIGDGVTVGFIAAQQMLFNGGSADRARTPTKFVPIQNVAITAGTPAAIWTPASSKKFHMMGFAVSLSVAGYVIFKDAAAEFLRTPAMAAGVGLVNPANLGNGYASTIANNILNMDVSASGSINGFVFGTEEF